MHTRQRFAPLATPFIAGVSDKKYIGHVYVGEISINAGNLAVAQRKNRGEMFIESFPLALGGILVTIRKEGVGKYLSLAQETAEANFPGLLQAVLHATQ
jgi:hypothetical protein